MSIYTEDGGSRLDSIKKWEYFYFDCLLIRKTNKVFYLKMIFVVFYNITINFRYHSVLQWK